jgi:Regulator of polyketide synthase expression
MSGLPLAELLGLPSLSRARLLAGDPRRRVGWVHVVDVPEPDPWVRPGQLVLTTGYAWPRKAPALRRFAEELAAGSAAIALAVPQFLETFPEPALSVLARAGVAALELPWEIPFAQVSEEVLGRLLAQQLEVEKRAQSLHRALMAALLERAGPALAAGWPLMGRGISLERALFYYTRPEASALPPARLWPGERADLVVFDRDPLEHLEEARVVRVEVEGVAVFTA